MLKVKNIQDFFKQFPDDDACLNYMMTKHYGETLDCPKCGKHGKFHRVTGQPAYECAWCGLHIHPMANTIFHRSHTSLQKWFYAMYLFTTTRNGVLAKELDRQLGVTYNTAWRMAHIIRDLMSKIGIEKLAGQVEADESCVGRRWPISTGRGRGAKNNIIVLRMKQRGGNMVARGIPE